MKKSVIFWFFFAVAFLTVPYAQLNHLLMMPGDVGDARLNNYFLENIYQFIQGNSPSLVHLNFFYPFPYVEGFSDNLFGSALAYLIPRALTGQADTAFQIWYLFGYFANYIAAYYALRKLDASVIASAVGALIFAFALPVTAQTSHAQLHYRFGVPLSIVMFSQFLEKKDWRCFAMVMVWMVWQFYCTIYIGFFLLLMLAAMLGIYVLRSVKAGAGGIKTITGDFVDAFVQMSPAEKIKLTVIFLVLLFLMVLLFYPYLQVSVLYEAKRGWHEIATMLPRPQSYFLADNSTLWSPYSKIITDIPMRHEHQLFVGVIPLLLAIGGFLVGRRQNNGMAFTLISGSLALVVLLTLSLGGLSLWYVLAKFPLASAIRAMARIVLVFLFPVAFLSAIAIDKLLLQRIGWHKILFVILVSFMLFEFSATLPSVSAKEEWRNRLVARESDIPENLPPNPILFYAQTGDYFYASEIDAMWIALNRGVPTLNGYSGFYPPDYSVEFGNDCTELPNRIRRYLGFTGQVDNEKAYRALMKRVVPVGFSGCNLDWFIKRQYTVSARKYSVNELKKLSFEYVGRGSYGGKEYVDVKVRNNGNLQISAASAVKKPVRLSWRFIDVNGKPLSGWETRKNLPFDIPANGSLDVRLPISQNSVAGGKTLQISMVQERVFWGHDVGIPPLEINWIPK